MLNSGKTLVNQTDKVSACGAGTDTKKSEIPRPFSRKRKGVSQAEEVTAESRQMSTSPRETGRQDIPGRWHCTYKGPEVGRVLVSSRYSEGASMAKQGEEPDRRWVLHFMPGGADQPHITKEETEAQRRPGIPWLGTHSPVPLGDRREEAGPQDLSRGQIRLEVLARHGFLWKENGS